MKWDPEGNEAREKGLDKNIKPYEIQVPRIL
jgi:hypothetical protein